MLKVATVGSGFIVDWFLNAVKQNEGIKCIAMYTRTKTKVEALAKQYEVDNIYEDYDLMLANQDIEVIYVGNVNSLHYEFAKKALLSGKHVICEKPFTSNLEELKDLFKIASDKGKYIFEAIVTTHMPNYLLLKESINDLGIIRMVQCNFSQYSSKYDKFLKGEHVNVFDLNYSGGALADISIYNLHFVIGLFGKPIDVHYFPNKASNGIDTSGVAILSYDGFSAVCVGCKDSRSKCLAQVQGEKGYAYLMSETSRCANLHVVITNEEVEKTIKQNDDALYYEVKEFVSIINQHDEARYQAHCEHSLAVMEVYEALRKDGGIIFASDRKSF